MNIIRAGSTLHFVETLPGGKRASSHLWVVVTDPSGNPASVVMVMLVTKRSYTDDTVILTQGDHPFVRHETSVSYSTAKHRSVDNIIGAINKGWAEMKQSLAADVLERIQDGLRVSPYTVHAIRDHCDQAWGD